jgi:hypothetical protein
MERIDQARAKEFLNASGYRTMRKKMLCSCNIKEFLQFLESFIKEEDFANDEKTFVDVFIQTFEDELPDVLTIVKVYA